MGFFDPVPGLMGRFESPLEIIATGSPIALANLRHKLTLHNTSVEQQIKRLKKTKPRSPQHLASIKTQLAELAPQLETKCYADTEDGVSIPPGCFYLCEKIENPEVIQNPQMDIKWVGHERPYQVTGVTNMFKYKRASLQIATGTGKSLCARVICRTLTSVGKRVLVVVPSIELLKQTFFPLQADGTFTVSMLGGGKIPKLGSQVIVSTMQSALNMADQFDAIIQDECQHVSCKTQQQLFAAAVNAEYVYGLSASPWRADGMTQLIWNFTGPIVFKYTGAQAIADGYLSPLIYVQKPVPVKTAPNPKSLPIKKYIFLHSANTYVSHAEKYVREALDKGRKVLVLFKSTQCCKKLGAKLGVQSADGDYRAPFYAFKNGESNLCIANTSLLGEGIDVPDISAIIYCAGSTSEISVVQAFGRGTRLAPNKKNCIILDLYPDLPDWRYKSFQRKRYFQSHFETLDSKPSTPNLTLVDEEGMDYVEE